MFHFSAAHQVGEAKSSDQWVGLEAEGYLTPGKPGIEKPDSHQSVVWPVSTEASADTTVPVDEGESSARLVPA